MSFPEYGDLIHVNFIDSEESPPGEFEDPHPAVVVQHPSDEDRGVVVAPVSSRDRQSWAREVQLPGTVNGLDEDSVVILNLITTVSFAERVKANDDDSNSWRLGKIPPKHMEDIQNKLGTLFHC
ncbi:MULTISPECIES: type II toxin-antitoxin system PemK/MazF family toxin [Halomicrobium]|uniref:Type II toxin-antitoxin system PemK/MazF family toxin n=1 Tax=Halomicrobium mukohataei TaxID=57705 RepID=A0A4D6KGN4_9EURY|nr:MULTISPECIES: type II toxin-antitoxin system PemK/MazF family toxin [Halomicrobium]QCD65043.1 type II toxin-antitoxin system PemK/MazF family toxin [Halomicrobium mukohataei]QFR19849.1 type II toxin-antitoxin system PemK/MazF family toxin [Halomicrobium sp. ZPS1]